MAPQRSLHIIDPMMISEAGHLFNQHLGIKQAAEARGWRVRSLLPRHMEDPDGRLTARLDAERSLSGLDFIEYRHPLIEVCAFNERLWSDLSRCLSPADVSGGDICLFPTLLPRGMHGVMRWYAQSTVKPALSMVLWCQECLDPHWGDVFQDLYRDFLAWVGSNLRTGYRFDLHAFSEPQAQLLRSIDRDGTAIGVFPVNGTAWNLPAPRPVGSDGPPTLGYLGNSLSPQKGLVPFLDAVQSVLARGAAARFLVHVDLRHADDGLKAEVARRGAVFDHRAVTRIDGTLTPEGYAEALNLCDAVVLPYGPQYDHQTSGILFEALILGKAVITRDRPQLAREFHALGIDQPLFSPWSADAVAKACETFLQRADHYLAESRSVSGRVRHLISPDRFLDDIGCVPILASPQAGAGRECV